MVQLVHAAGGRTAEQNPREPFGRTLCRVAITWCDQKLVAFNGALHRNTTRYRGHLTSASHPFAPKYDHDTTTGQATVAEERAVLERVTRVGVYSMLDPSLLPKDPPLRIQRVFHGVGSFDAVLGILGGDFAQLQKTDKGWYGAGFYFTPDLDYACAYAQPCTVSADHDNVPPDLHCLNLEPGKSYRIVLACDVMYGNPYPVKQTSVHPMLQAIPVQQLPTPRWRSFIGLPLVAGHDAHVAVVDFTSGKVKAALPFETHSQWTQGDNVPAAEIVVTDPSCVLSTQTVQRARAQAQRNHQQGKRTRKRKHPQTTPPGHSGQRSNDSNNGTAATAAATATTDNDEGQPRSAPVTSRSPGGPAATEPPATV
ncbi:hypothetical protein PTSG_08612 [Salpingoeca rosetta]|uniref:PARP catalytic domain-containing protein n=1 Tax=Salpingoeca rosetta (strain ATCC 50818 / BSB-021) TaxID=946362 RepID=F2UK65_SALR5|nr:uncharacterized protein PTSG_08612 [Salpingoeca rosetta]EGD77514.1 hypothetical protein PTSG_08612 [Salpingoeca rosetta]|eukprot:XP_004990402.1 hypothetical protein PTSG_08612 [Salpingoeca rosetta]